MGYRDAQLLFSDRKLSFALFRLSNDVTKRTVANQISAFFPSSSHPFISILFFDLSYFSGSSPFFSRLFQFIISCRTIPISVVMIFASKQKPSRFECLIFRTPQNRNHYKLGKKERPISWCPCNVNGTDLSNSPFVQPKTFHSSGKFGFSRCRSSKVSWGSAL